MTATDTTRPAGLRTRVRSRLPLYWKPLLVALSGVGIAFLAFVMLIRPQTMGFDAFAYWSVDPLHPYEAPLGSVRAFTYSPAAALLFAPAHLVSFAWFYILWAAFLAVVLVWLCRRYTLAWLAFLPVPLELYHANVHLLIAAVCVLGFRYPALWSFALLTKLTPGVCLLWFAVRREWRSLAVALGVTAAIAAVSFAIAPYAWPDWLRFLADSSAAGPGVNDKSYLVLVPPLWLRMVAAALIVVWGARTDRRWTMPVAATIALPVLWITGPAILAAIPRLTRTAPRGAPAPVLAPAAAPAPSP